MVLLQGNKFLRGCNNPDLQIIVCFIVYEIAIFELIIIQYRVVTNKSV